MSESLNKLESKLDRMDTKFDKINDRIDSLDRTTVKQQVILEEHMRRAEANEEAVKLLAHNLEMLKEKNTAEFSKINRHTTMVEGVIKFFGALIAVLGAAQVIIGFWSK